MKHIRTFSLLMISIVSANCLAFDRADYTYESLQQTWNQSINPLAPDQRPYEFFTKVEITPNSANAPAGFCNSDDPLELNLCEAAKLKNAIQASSTVTGPRVVGVFSLYSTEASVLYPRLLGLQHYLNRHEEYQTFRSEQLPPVKMIELEKRKSAVLAELFLAHLRLYYSEPTLSSKCMRIKRANNFLMSMGDNPVQQFSEIGLETHVLKALNRLPASIYTELRNPSVCRLVGVRNQVAEKSAMEFLTSEKLRAAIDEKLVLTQNAIAGASAAITGLVNRLQGKDGGIPIVTDRVFQLELDINRAASNMSLVANDKYGVKGIAEASRETPQLPAGTLIPKKVSEAITKGPVKLEEGKAEIFAAFNSYTKTMQGFVDFLLSKKREQCTRSPTRCPEHCSALEEYSEPGKRLSDRFKPVDASANTPRASSTDPRTDLNDFKARLDLCLSDFNRLVEQSSATSTGEEYQLQFSRDMNRFYPLILK